MKRAMKRAISKAGDSDSDEENFVVSSSSSSENEKSPSKRSRSNSPPDAIVVDSDDEQNEFDAEVLAPDTRLTQLQREATDWMAQREVDAGGGLLTDEMGLGKTLSVLYTIAQYKLANPCEDIGQTLVVCPPILFETWENEITKRFRRGLFTVARYGSSEDRKSIQLTEEGRIPKRVDIILTSYNRLYLDIEQHLTIKLDREDEKTAGEKLLSERHFRRSDRAMLLSSPWFQNKIDQDLITVSAPLARAGLFSIRWRRVVLDEAHKASNASTKTFAAIMCLAADFRWWVTGTPIQNRYADAVSALLFLREPSICKEIPEAPPKELRLDQTMNDQEWRASKVYQRWAYGRTIQGLMDQREELLRADPLLKYMVELEFNTFEHAVKFTHTEEQEAHLKHVRRLRRVAQLLAERGGVHALASAVGFDAKRTVAPLDAKEEAVVVKEVDELLQAGKKEGEVLLSFYMRARQVCVDLRLAGEPALPNGKLSTKFQLLVDDVRTRMTREEKFIVFSEWVEALKMAEDALERVGHIRVVMLHGRMSVQKRREALRQFKENPKIRGICMQIDCGGLGLTITEANRIYQLEPMLNPQREKQGFGRIRRPGQTRHMSVTYLLIARSIEEIVRSTAAKKLRLAERIQGRNDRAALSSLDVLRDVNLLLLSSKDDPAYRERDGELEYLQGLEQRRQYEIPPGFETTLSRAQIQAKVRVFLGAFAAYSAVRTIPSSSVLFRLSTRHRDLLAQETRKKDLEARQNPPAAAAAASPKKPVVSSRGEAPVDSLQVALDPLKLRRWLFDDFFKQFKTYEAERASRMSAPFGDLYDVSNYAQLEHLAETQIDKWGYASVDPVRAHLPNDFLRALQLAAKPMLVLHHTTEALITDRQVYGAYDARAATGDLVVVRGDAATRLRDSVLYPGAPVNLDVHVLVSFAPLWLDPVLSSLLPMPSVAIGEELFKNPSTMWVMPPAVPELDSPPVNYKILDRSSASYPTDGTALMRDVGELLLLAVAQTVRDQDSSILTALLATLLVAPVKTDSIERRVFICQSIGTGSLLGVATAIVIRNANVTPSRPVVAIVAPAVYVSLRFSESPESLRNIAGRLGRVLVASLFDSPNVPGGLTYAYQSGVESVTSFPLHPGVPVHRFRARLVAAQRGFVSFIEKTTRTEGGNEEPRFQFAITQTSAAGGPTAGINWPVETQQYIDGFLTWQHRVGSPMLISAEAMELS